MLKLLRNRHFPLKNFELLATQFKKSILSSNLSDFVQPNLKTTQTTPNQIYSYINEHAENSYAYSIIKSLPSPYRGTFQLQSPSSVVKSEDELAAVLDQNWRTRSATEIVDAFRNAVHYCNENEVGLSDARFDKLVDGLMDNVEYLTDEELSQLMICVMKFPPSRMITAHNFHDVWSALDDICCSRVEGWDSETRFKFAELWYLLRLGG